MYATLISGDRTVEGATLEQRVLKVAGGLTELGLVPGDVIAILMRNDFPFFEVTLGANRTGIIAVPLNWHSNPEEIDFILKDSGAQVLFAHTDLLKGIAAGIPSTCKVVEVPTPPEVRQAYRLTDLDCAPTGTALDYESWVQASEPSTAEPVPTPINLMYTSGTTGRPKGVERAAGTPDFQARFSRNARTAHGQLMPNIRAIVTGPLYHGAPYVYSFNSVHVADLLVLQPRFNAEELLDLVERHHLNHMHAVPTMFNRLLDLPAERKAAFDPSPLRAVVHGSAMCPPEIKRAMIDWWGPVLLEYYASTELGVITASTSEQWLAHPGTVGTPPEGVELKVVDDDGKALPIGETGEIYILSDVATVVNYHNRPDAMEELQRGDGWETLGDVGHLDDDGFLWISDRKKDMVNVGGVKIFPAELEQVALQFPGVRDCVAFGIPDRDLGEALAMVVEPHTDAELDTDKLRENLRERLGTMRAPKVILTMPALPREDSGKIARRKLKQQYLDSVPLPTIPA